MDAVEGSKKHLTQPIAPDSKPRSRRGFAGMDPALVRKLASKGGRAAHEQGTAHEFTSDEAKTAGRLGGIAPHRPRRTKKA
jgi:general stress protein YciG